MLRGRHAEDDINKILGELRTREATLADVVQVLSLQVKLLMAIRSNQVTMMTYKGVIFRKSNRKNRTEEKKAE